MSLGRIFVVLIIAFVALFMLRRILLFLRGGLSVETMTDLKTKGAIIIDVRTPGEFANGHSPESRNIPLDELGSHLDKLDRSKPLVLCCTTGARSGWAQRYLKQMGFQEVYNAGPWQKTL
ncbi:MAG: rhodanese-like domain-containing protein [Firmicutes bacterium]|nr:rhodanese-like domain-containing protein [Bacillota bacterium]